jgi:hypothetical protein
VSTHVVLGRELLPKPRWEGELRFLRNWLLPILFCGIGALLGFLVLGLPGFNMVQTLDGSPVVGGVIPPEQVADIIAQGREIGSYIDFYGIALPGTPFFWMIGIIAAPALAGYRFGSIFRSEANR